MSQFCRKCGAKLADEDRFCYKCGTPVRQKVAASDAATRGDTPVRDDDTVQQPTPDDAPVQDGTSTRKQAVAAPGNETVQQQVATAHSKVNARVARAVRRLQHGDESGFAELFDCTKGYVATCIRVQNVPADSLDDVMQEVYLKVYRSISTLSDPTKAMGWIKAIAFNESRTFFRTHSGSGGEVPVETVTDEQMENNAITDAALDVGMRLPENIVESKETQQVLLGFVDELSEDLSSLFYAHYLNEMSAADIARAIGANESTVRSRLMRSREKLQRRVDDYSEKTGVKMRYSAIAPVLWFLLRDTTTQLISASGLTAQVVLAKVHEMALGASTTATSAQPVAGPEATATSSQPASGPSATAPSSQPPTGSGNAAHTAVSTAKHTGWFATHKAVVAIVAAIVIGAGAGGSYLAVNSSHGDQSGEQPVAEAPAENAEEDTSAVDPVAMADAYGKVLDDVVAGKYDFTNPAEPAITISSDSYPESLYALQDINGDDIPELLVQCPGMDVDYSSSMNQLNMLAFTYTGGESAIKLDGVVSFWFSSSGTHTETDLYTMAGNGGVYKRLFDRVGYVPSDTAQMVPDPLDPRAANTYRYTKLTVEGNALVETDLGATIPSDVGSMVEFTSIGDRSQLQILAGTSEDEVFDSKVAAARANGQTVYVGTVREMNDYEYLDFQEETGDITPDDAEMMKKTIDSYVSEYGYSVGSYTVLVFDDATDTTAEWPMEGLRTIRSHSILIGDPSVWQPYVGKKVAVSAEPSEGYFGDDASATAGIASFELNPDENLVAAL